MPAKVVAPQTIHPFLHPLRMQRRCRRPPKFIDHALFSGINQSALVPLTTFAILPPHSAEVTEFGLAATRDVEAAHLKFNDVLTTRTGLPRVRLCQSAQLDGRGSDAARFTPVLYILAQRADDRDALIADHGAADSVRGAKELGAGRSGAIQAKIGWCAEFQRFGFEKSE
jgi:hypothetical protein